MPSPSVFEWCSSSLSSIHQSLNRIIGNEPSEVSRYTASIFSLKGKTPAQKYKDLNEIVDMIVKNTQAKGKISAEDDVSPEMASLVQTIVGAKMKFSNLIIEGLKSQDQKVVNKALHAEWFFIGSNEHVHVEFFMENIMPFVSSRTRNAIVKQLSYSLEGYEEKSEQFFSKFSELYGLELSLILLNSCSESYVFEKILEHKLILPLKILERLYVRHPSLAIKYLHLGIKHDSNYMGNQAIHEIKIDEYIHFLPNLLKEHPQEFIQLYKVTSDTKLRLGRKKSAIFMKELKTHLIDEPNIFLKLLSLKDVHANLEKTELNCMLDNFLPKYLDEFNLDLVLDVLEHNRHGNTLELIREKCKNLYSKDLLHNGMCKTSSRLFKLLPVNEKRYLARNWMEKDEEAPDLFNAYTFYLPPNEALPILKKKISSTSKINDRAEIISSMIKCCSYYHSKQGLAEVLRYYYDKHKNEQNLVHKRFLQSLNQEFDISALSENHWKILNDILYHAYVKKELFNTSSSLVESILESALSHVLNDRKNDQSTINKISEMIVECKIDNSSRSWNVLKNQPQLEKESLKKFLQLIAQRYPENHSVWENKCDKLARLLSIVRSIADYNDRNFPSKCTSKSKTAPPMDFDVDEGLRITDYSWLLRLSEDFFSRSENGIRKKLLMKILRMHATDFYECKMNELSIIRDIESGEALSLLKTDPGKIFANWSEYLSEARQRLHQNSRSAVRFITACKWHTDISVKFIERCLAEMTIDGSVIVLGILLEGSAFEKAIAPFIPKDGSLESPTAKANFKTVHSILRAMRYTNPPVSLETIASFCQGDYLSIAEGTLFSVAQRVPTNKILEFAEGLLGRNVSLSKRGLRLIEKIATKPKLRQVLSNCWSSETNSSKRQLIGKTIMDLFMKQPGEGNWNLVRECFKGLSVEDDELIEKFSNIDNIDRSYLSEFIEEYVIKIEKLATNGLKAEKRNKCVSILVENIDSKSMKILEDSTILALIRNYFYNPSSLETSRVVRKFAVRCCLESSDEQFESRLEGLIEMFDKLLGTFNDPHPKAPRFYVAIYTIREFVEDLLEWISNADSKKSMAIVDKILNTLTFNLLPWQVSSSYLSLNLYKESLSSNSPKEFGHRCAKRIPEFVEELTSNDSVVDDIADCLNSDILRKIFMDVQVCDKNLAVIQGFLEGDSFYGALVASKLLDHREVSKYSDEYDEIIRSLRTVQNKSVQYNLYKHLSRIEYDF
ncbi:hypothetical protein QAD02_010888 [Eretmocerus hayati]|uniref:Uncharacterized protein n=1 Tax=Eretmocerus hayati TaxID=131215 RepID=A0ACC2NY22_9HYME|nr:hypothetical protein QAD02_010888 [Eretmocerus hayati]